MDSTSHHHHKPNPSSSDLVSSAKLVAEAVNATLHHETDKIDKAKVAGAGADLLEAASHYGKLEEKSFGKYVAKAEEYLHSYGSSQSAAGHGHSPAGHGHSPAGNTHSESGFGDYMKMAQGFLKK